MSLRRFTWFLSHLHLNDNSMIKSRDDPDFDRLHKVRPFLDHLQSKFLQLYSPTEHQAIDESMIKFKGRQSMKQYVPLKPIKRGYKVWVRADDNGYTCESEVYTGKARGTTEHGLGGSVVTKLSEKIQGKGYKVYADNFFSSVGLAKSLSDKGIGYCGTIRSNRRHLPALTEDKKLKRGNFDWRMDEAGISLVKWMDTKALSFISNFELPSHEVPISRKNKDGSTTVVSGPSVASSYRNHMGAVDKADMLKSLYEIDRKSHKWWHRIFFHFLDVAVVNASIIFKQMSDESMTLKTFKRRIIAGLINSKGLKRSRESEDMSVNAMNLNSKTKESVAPEIRKDASEHLPHLGNTFRRCNNCSTKKEPHRTKWMCPLCNVPLCNSAKRNCFTVYHS